MKNARWEEIVEDLEYEAYGKRVCESADVLKLLARQHAATVRLVKRREAGVDNYAFRDGYDTAKHDILAAQATQEEK